MYLRRISFSDASYEVSVYDSTVSGVNGKSFAGCIVLKEGLLI